MLAKGNQNKSVMSIEELQDLKEKEIQEKYEALASTAGSELIGSYQIFKAGYLANEQPSGNQYTGYLKDGNKTLEKVRPDEPIFILRGQDKSAPEVVQHWIAKNLDVVEEPKLKEAWLTVLAMRRYDSRRDPT